LVFLGEFNRFGPGGGKLGPDSGGGGGANSAKVEAGVLSPPHFNH